jgi:hypothetical protein
LALAKSIIAISDIASLCRSSTQLSDGSPSCGYRGCSTPDPMGSTGQHPLWGNTTTSCSVRSSGSPSQRLPRFEKRA